MPTPTDIVNRYYQAINEGAWDLYEELFTADAALEAPGGITATGPAAMRAFDQIWTSAFTGFTVTPVNQVASGGAVMSENLVAGVHTGTLVTPGGNLPASGATLDGKYVGVFEVVDGRIAAQHIYYDRMIVVELLGAQAPHVGAAV